MVVGSVTYRNVRFRDAQNWCLQRSLRLQDALFTPHLHFEVTKKSWEKHTEVQKKIERYYRIPTEFFYFNFNAFMDNDFVCCLENLEVKWDFQTSVKLGTELFRLTIKIWIKNVMQATIFLSDRRNLWWKLK